jgi:FkbM family methyltransferase
MSTLTIKSAVFNALRHLVRPLFGTGISRLPVIKNLYRNFLLSFVNTPLTVNGYKMFWYPEHAEKDDRIMETLFAFHNYEPYTTSLFKRFVSEGMTVVDVGANHGYFTLLASKLVGDKGKVFAFEPDPESYATLVKNIELNGYKNIAPLQKAVSDRRGKATLFQYEGSGVNSLLVSYHRSIGSRSHQSVVVDCISLDEFFEEKKREIDVIKIDVEGGEVSVLKSMKKILETSNELKIFIEFNLDFLLEAGIAPQEYFDQLTSSGYKYIYRIDETEGKIETTDCEQAVEFCYKLKSPRCTNLLCSKCAINVDNNIQLTIHKVSTQRQNRITRP